MRGRLFSVAVTTAGMLTTMAAPNAWADKPVKIPVDGNFTAEFDGVCQGFPILFEQTGNVSDHTLVLFDRSGDLRAFLLTGFYSVRLTNELTGNSVSVNVPGQGVLDPLTGVTVEDGAWINVEFDDPSTSAWDGFAIYTAGRTLMTRDENGRIVLGATKGLRRDLCAELSAP